ncbi:MULTISPECIES: hypothetical protein [unclassified Microcoleus]|uniref:hypothetical protein n=1 Tax=unclassified Microcoleus TaxID=2642155 RepID=UPI002FD2A08F
MATLLQNMPIAPNINIMQANKYSGFLVAEISLKKRTFPRNPVSVMKVLTESIQDTRHVIHPSRNKKPVSDETCRTYLSRASQSKI